VFAISWKSHVVVNREAIVSWKAGLLTPRNAVKATNTSHLRII